MRHNQVVDGKQVVYVILFMQKRWSSAKHNRFVQTIHCWLVVCYWSPTDWCSLTYYAIEFTTAPSTWNANVHLNCASLINYRCHCNSLVVPGLYQLLIIKHNTLNADFSLGKVMVIEPCHACHRTRWDEVTGSNSLRLIVSLEWLISWQQCQSVLCKAGAKCWFKFNINTLQSNMCSVRC